MLKIPILFLLIALVSCVYNDRTRVLEQTQADLTKNTAQITDTLRDPNHYNFAQMLIRNYLQSGF